jgi:Rps23 Pro-64 3,4-dihydroxylase Tpa1-like proline 4-hydroxylase
MSSFAHTIVLLFILTITIIQSVALNVTIIEDEQQLPPDFSFLNKFKTNTTDINHRYLQSITSDYWKLLQEHTTKNLKLILQKNLNYKNRLPFPHCVLDDLFPIQILSDIVSKEIIDNPKQKQGCIHGSRCYYDEKQKFKNAFDSDEYFGPATSTMFAYLKSSTFIKFLEQLTGIEDLVPDPHFRGSGIHQTLGNGFLNIHADFNRYEKYDMYRRVNILLYLNPDWKEEYGGHLELWSKDMKSCMVRTSPDIGKLTIFSSTDFSYHGHPEPLNIPADRSRRSLAMYYYTRTRPTDECIKGNCKVHHTTLFKTPKCGKSCLDTKCNKLIENQK